MAKDLYIERLRAVPLFARLSKKELGMLLRQADHLRFPARYEVVKAGTQGEEFWLVAEGKLSVHRGGKQVATIGPGDFFGELAVIDPAPRDATVVTETPAELLVVGRQRFWALVEEVHPLSRKLMIAMAQRLRESDAATSGKAAKKA